jgi:hypothetical protein
VKPTNRKLFVMADKYDLKKNVPDCEVHLDGNTELYSIMEKEKFIERYSKPLESHSSFVIQ